MVFNGGKIWQPMSSDLFLKYKYVKEDLWCAPINLIEKTKKIHTNFRGATWERMFLIDLPSERPSKSM